MTSQAASDVPAGRTPRRRVLFFALLFLAALLPRLAYQAALSESPFWEAPILDEAVNHEWAAGLATGGGIGDLPFFRAPLYPWLLGATYSVVGVEPGRARLLQAFLSSVTCVLVGLVAWRVFGRLGGWCAGLLAAFYWPWIYFDGELQDVPLTLFCNLAALALLAGWKPGSSSRQLLGAGLLLGLSVITRPTVLITIPAIVAWVFLARASSAHGGPSTHGKRQRLVASGFLLTGVILIMAPVTLLNRFGGDDAVLVSSQGGMNFYIGNHAGSDGHSARFPGARADWSSMVEASRLEAEASVGRRLRPSEVSDHWYGKGWEFWRQHPAEAFRLALRKTGFLLAAAELPNNKQIRFLLSRFAPWLGFPFVGFALILGLAVVGAVWGRGTPAKTLLLAFSLSYAAAVVGFFVNARFRMPVVAIWIVLAGGGLAVLIQAARRVAWKELLLPAMTLLLVASGAVLGSRGWEENLGHGHYTLARAYRQAQDNESAESAFREALEADPALAEAALGLSALLLETARPGEAARLLEAVVQREPGDVRSRLNLSLALRADGRPGAAVAMLRQAVHDRPGEADLWVWLGDAEMAAGDPAAAVGSYEEALGLEPSRIDARFQQANAWARLARHEQAIAAYRQLLASHPRHIGGWSMLGIALSETGDLRAAVDAFAAAARLAPGDGRGHLNLGRAWEMLGDMKEAAASYQRALEAAGPESEAGSLARQALQGLSERR